MKEFWNLSKKNVRKNFEMIFYKVCLKVMLLAFLGVQNSFWAWSEKHAFSLLGFAVFALLWKKLSHENAIVGHFQLYNNSMFRIFSTDIK